MATPTWPDSRVEVVRIAIDDPRGIWRLLRPGAREILTFGAIGVVSTLAYAALYLLIRSVLPATIANALALVVTAIGNTAANRRLTFGVRGRDLLVRDHVSGLLAFGIALAITTGAVAVLDRMAPGVSHLVELVVLVGANVVATVVRFLLLRAWIAGPRRIARRSGLVSTPERTDP
jgi:putative flippase GtrA